MIDALVVVLAVALDRMLGEPRRFHPLVGFGNQAAWLEQRLNRPENDDLSRRLLGLVALVILVLPPMLLLMVLSELEGAAPLLGLVVLFLAMGGWSLERHVRAVGEALASGDLIRARQGVGAIVSRDTDHMDEPAISRAAVESALENSSDALFASLFWFALAGAPGVLLHRLVNTLDAMWGYRNERFHAFGWAAARLDDALNWIPARLTALGFMLLGGGRRAWRCWQQQAPLHDSPNAGVVMATGAATLGLELGGAAVYHGEFKERPVLGEGRPPQADDIEAALGLIRRSLVLWLGLMLLFFLL